MAIYRDVCEVLNRDGYTKEVYRFQGAKTKSKFSVCDEVSRDYIYFSTSLEHHEYFTVKRLKQMLNEQLMHEYGIIFSNKTLHGTYTYPAIKNFVLNSDSIKSLYSFRLITCRAFDGLIKDNYQYNMSKQKNSRCIERVDRRVYGGGYGVADEWKQLMVYLTYFSAQHKISREELLELIRNMAMSGKISNKNNIEFILGADSKYMYEINPHMESVFNKYNIINTLEAILEKGLFEQTSELARNPHRTIREVVDEYEKGREKTLELLGKRKY